jgi:transmembrane sensor
VAEVQVRALPGTVRVRSLDGKPIDILVNQGDVTVQAGTSAPRLMSANMRVLLPATGAGAIVPQTIPSELISRELAWRDGKVAFEGERLDQAAAEFARYSRTRIVVTDPALAGEPVTGLFSAGDPIGFSTAIAGIFDARIDVTGDVVTLAPKPPPTKK